MCSATRQAFSWILSSERYGFAYYILYTRLYTRETRARRHLNIFVFVDLLYTLIYFGVRASGHEINSVFCGCLFYYFFLLLKCYCDSRSIPVVRVLMTFAMRIFAHQTSDNMWLKGSIIIYCMSMLLFVAEFCFVFFSLISSIYCGTKLYSFILYIDTCINCDCVAWMRL